MDKVSSTFNVGLFNSNTIQREINLDPNGETPFGQSLQQNFEITVKRNKKSPKKKLPVTTTSIKVNIVDNLLPPQETADPANPLNSHSALGDSQNSLNQT